MNVNNFKVTPNSVLRAMAREQLKGNWGKAVLVFLLFTVITGICGAIPYIGFIISLVIMGPMTLGLNIFFLKLKRQEAPVIENLFDGFKRFAPSLVLYILVNVFTFLWSLLFIIPGIIASIRYSQAFLIMADNPDISAMEAINRSKEMMQGNKGKYFCLYISFIGWFLVCLATFGIGFLWLYPYGMTAFVNFYEDIKGDAPQNDQPVYNPGYSGF